MWIQFPFPAMCLSLPELLPQYAMNSHFTVALLSYVLVWSDLSTFLTEGLGEGGSIPHQDLAPMAFFL